MKRCCTFVLTLLMLTCAVAQEENWALRARLAARPLDQFIVLRERAFVVGGPIFGIGPRVIDATWSANGQHILVERAVSSSAMDALTAIGAPTDETHVLSILTVSNGKNLELSRYDSPGSVMTSSGWMSGSDSVLLVKAHLRQAPADPVYGVLLGSATSGDVRSIVPWRGEVQPRSIIAKHSNSLPLALVAMSFQGGERGEVGSRPEMLPDTHQIALLNDKGDLRHIKLPDENVGVTISWSSDGKTPYLMQFDAMDNKRHTYRIDLQTGLVVADSHTEFPTHMKPVQPFAIREVGMVTANGQAVRSMSVLWLESSDVEGQNRVLLGGDARTGQINAQNTAICYVAQDSLFLRKMTEVPKKVFEEITQEANRQQAMREVRAIGLALMMYAADNNDELPAKGVDILSLIADRLRDPALGGRFVYEFAGGSLGESRNPAEDHMGYIEIEGGRAVVFLDGHVEFVPNNKPA